MTIEAVSPVVQVVTVGTDWPAIVAVISTGIVGLAGIGATLWQARRNWNIENARTRLSEKRRIYATYISSLHKAIESYVVVLTLGKNKSKRTLERNAPEREYTTALAMAVSTFHELSLIAPRDVTTLAAEAMEELTNVTIGNSRLFTRTVSRMSDAMRADLGEPPLESEVEAPILDTTQPPKL